MGVVAIKEGEVRTVEEMGGLATMIRFEFGDQSGLISENSRMGLEAETIGVVQEGALMAHRSRTFLCKTRSKVLFQNGIDQDDDEGGNQQGGGAQARRAGGGGDGGGGRVCSFRDF